jgi:glycosyltransferase involved in cell wall biosynthesis/2-polyprenyl-3-methyl-5-hydroxy-6-metoxy-1,4-benzoquinol methylase
MNDVAPSGLKILFVSHSADRSGAPLVLLNFLRWIRRNRTDVDFDVLLYRGGPLEQDFRKLGRVLSWDLDYGFLRKPRGSLSWGEERRQVRHFDELLGHLRDAAYDRVFVNSFASSEVVPAVAGAVSCPVICRAPELKFVVEDYCGLDNVRKAIRYIDRFIAVSDMVRSYMRAELGIADEWITRIPGFFVPHETGHSRAEVRHELGIGDDEFVVCACGTLSWRKGIDLFVSLAARMRQSLLDRRMRFLWVGHSYSTESRQMIEHDLARLGLVERVLLLGEKPAAQPYLAAADVMALLSREDPFPVTAMEAASVGLPVVCFEGATGSTEFIDDSCGAVVPYLDIEECARRVETFAADPARHAAARAEIRRRSARYAIDTVAPQLMRCIEETGKRPAAVMPEPPAPEAAPDADTGDRAGLASVPARPAIYSQYYDFTREEMLKFVPVGARRVLEIGCANGRFSELIRERQRAEVWGIDAEAAAVEEARTRLDKALHGDVHDLLGTVPAAYFDCVVCNDVLEHLPDPGRVLDGIVRVLADGGVVVASIPNMRYLPVLYELLVRKDWKYRGGGVLDRTHLRFFTRRSIRRLFEDAGFEMIRMEGIQMRVPVLYRLAFLIATVSTLGYYDDTRFIQYACVARVRGGGVQP